MINKTTKIETKTNKTQNDTKRQAHLLNKNKNKNTT